MNTGKVNLIFKKKGDDLVAYISIIEGGLKGVSGKWNIPKREVVAPKSWKMRPYVNYRCEVTRCKDGNFIIIGAVPLRFNVSLHKRTHKCGGRYIFIQIGDKRVFLDPVRGQSEHSRTIDGAIRAVNMLTNNFDKIGTIKQLEEAYKHWVLPQLVYN